LRLDISVSDAFFFEIEQSSEELITEDFQFKPTDLTFIFIALNMFIEIAREIIHHNVQILFISFIGEIRVSNAKYIWMME